MSEKMTREEAAARLSLHANWNRYKGEIAEAFDLAISALREQPCEKCERFDTEAHELSLKIMEERCNARCAEWEAVFDSIAPGQLLDIKEGAHWRSYYPREIDPCRKPKNETQTAECLTDETQTESCDDCHAMRELSDKHFEAYMALQIKRAEAEDRCAEWEEAWDAFSRYFVQGLADYATWRVETIQGKLEALDPRRKSKPDPASGGGRGVENMMNPEWDSATISWLRQLQSLKMPPKTRNLATHAISWIVKAAELEKNTAGKEVEAR